MSHVRNRQAGDLDVYHVPLNVVLDIAVSGFEGLALA